MVSRRNFWQNLFLKRKMSTTHSDSIFTGILQQNSRQSHSLLPSNPKTCITAFVLFPFNRFQAKRHNVAGNIAAQVGMIPVAQPPLEAAPTPQGYAQHQAMGSRNGDMDVAEDLRGLAEQKPTNSMNLPQVRCPLSSLLKQPEKSGDNVVVLKRKHLLT